MSLTARVIDRVATANIYSGLDRDQALRALTKVLDTAGRIDAIGLQEWPRRRHRIEAAVEAAYPLLRFHRPRIGGNGPIALDVGRYDVDAIRSATLHRPGRVDRSPGRRRFLGPSLATVVVAHDRRLDEPVTFVNYHLTAEVQRGAGYRHDRPLRVARHRREVRRLEALIRRQQAKGRTVYALGDSNYHGLELAGVVSAWEGRKPRGTHAGGNRAIDDVHGPGQATEVTLVPTASDHDAVIATRRRTR